MVDKGKGALAFNDGTKGSSKDFSDIDMSKLQYTSKMLEEIRKDKLAYNDMIETISSMAFAEKSMSFMVGILKKKYPQYCATLNVQTFKKWSENYGDIAKALHFKKDLCLGQLVYWGMKKAEKSIDKEKDDTIVKLIDRMDNGIVNYKNSVEAQKKAEAAYSENTRNTLGRIFAEASRFGGMDGLSVEEAEGEEDED